MLLSGTCYTAHGPRLAGCYDAGYLCCLYWPLLHRAAIVLLPASLCCQHTDFLHAIVVLKTWLALTPDNSLSKLLSDDVFAYYCRVPWWPGHRTRGLFICGCLLCTTWPSVQGEQAVHTARFCA
jgi:hypothetical protein